MAEPKADLTEGGKKPEAREERRSEDANNRRRDGMFCAAYLMILFLVYIVVFKPEINEFAKTVINIVVGMFLRELAGMFAAEFGTTRGAEKKDEAIANMAKTAGVTANTAQTLADTKASAPIAPVVGDMTGGTVNVNTDGGTGEKK